MNAEVEQYGSGDRSYNAAGQLLGITRLVAMFYDYMETLPEAKGIRAMHPEDLTLSKQKLTYFLSGWLGGPKLYSQHFGGINIPSAHGHLKVNKAQSEAWLLCMSKAVEQQPYHPKFKQYLMAQLRVPAQRIVAVCKSQHQ